MWPELRRSPPWLAAEEILDLGALWVVIDKEKRVEVLHAFSQALHRAWEVVAVERLTDAKTDRYQVEVAVAQHKHPAGGPSIPSHFGVEQDVRRHDRDAGNLTNGLKGLHFDGVRPPWSERLHGDKHRQHGRRRKDEPPPPQAVGEKGDPHPPLRFWGLPLPETGDE